MSTMRNRIPSAARVARRHASYSGNPDGKPIYDVDIDHGYENAISGGSNVMQGLVNDLRREQGNPPMRLASGRAEVYITDMGGPLATVGPKGEENIGRYGVWDGRGRRKPEVVATGDDLQKLQREYGPGLPVIRL